MQGEDNLPMITPRGWWGRWHGLHTQVCLMPEPGHPPLQALRRSSRNLGTDRLFAFWNVDSKLVLYPQPLYPLLTWEWRGCG